MATTTPPPTTTPTTVIDAYKIIRDPVYNIIYVHNWSVTCPVEKVAEEEEKLKALGYKIARSERDRVIMRMQVILPPPLPSPSSTTTAADTEQGGGEGKEATTTTTISDSEILDLYLSNIYLAKQATMAEYNNTLDLQDNKDKELLLRKVEVINEEAKSRLVNEALPLIAASSTTAVGKGGGGGGGGGGGIQVITTEDIQAISALSARDILYDTAAATTERIIGRLKAKIAAIGGGEKGG